MLCGSVFYSVRYMVYGSVFYNPEYMLSGSVNQRAAILVGDRLQTLKCDQQRKMTEITSLFVKYGFWLIDWLIIAWTCQFRISHFGKGGNKERSTAWSPSSVLSKVIGAPQMTKQPVSPISPCSSTLPSGICWAQDLSIPGYCPPICLILHLLAMLWHHQNNSCLSKIYLDVCLNCGSIDSKTAGRNGARPTNQYLTHPQVLEL